jgi:hypothetical protein
MTLLASTQARASADALGAPISTSTITRTRVKEQPNTIRQASAESIPPLYCQRRNGWFRLHRARKREQQRKRLKQLEAERRKLLQAHDLVRAASRGNHPMRKKKPWPSGPGVPPLGFESEQSGGGSGI